MAPVASHASAASRSAAQAPLRIFYDRLAVALLGCLAVPTLLIGGVLALVSVVSGWVPLIALLVGLASFSTLRGLAVRDRRKKLLARLDATRTRAMETGRTPVAEPAKKAAEVFDAQPNSNKRPPRLTVQELRAEALRIAHKGAAVQRPEGWEPTEVPLPQYVVANTAKRQAPAPLQATEAPKASSNATLRAQEAAARLAEATGAANAATDSSIATLPVVPATPVVAQADQAPAARAPSAGSAPSTAPKTAAEPSSDNGPRAPRTEKSADRINLDDVMQRRRA
ncbi:hypothetical protein GCM10009715_18720 [Paeniglutamicibacter psychrophenolicus]|uniref:Pyruvate/2-oxoglutarate dehydrogenase complex dihydrolipoamide acyltransferase (E2) component n=1 Tax=Paeniglutamicibacter psychrophenolicus TaxID=257454 RepID=A0ABS4WD39_9MICC|nr:hypothetical protein [Paeniglutamicibacter psychrophenolicus]MBP2374117.1 pyruvate/2-oxoglutarate dehydrogenase complex dihydrolipoamide acyltransferase (E2) component [Paeniglutamicibacter psychrophenolicus]